MLHAERTRNLSMVAELYNPYIYLYIKRLVFASLSLCNVTSQCW
jgi:hypothetical protein